MGSNSDATKTTEEEEATQIDDKQKGDTQKDNKQKAEEIKKGENKSRGDEPDPAVESTKIFKFFLLNIFVFFKLKNLISLKS